MYYNEVSVENEIILHIFAEKGPYNMTMWFVVHLIVTDTYRQCHNFLTPSIDFYHIKAVIV